MTKIRVLIEEHLCKEIEVDIPSNTPLGDIHSTVANIVHGAYLNEEIVLTADDYNGVTQILINPDNNDNWEKL